MTEWQGQEREGSHVTYRAWGDKTNGLLAESGYWEGNVFLGRKDELIDLQDFLDDIKSNPLTLTFLDSFKVTKLISFKKQLQLPYARFQRVHSICRNNEACMYGQHMFHIYVYKHEVYRTLQTCAYYKSLVWVLGASREEQDFKKITSLHREIR